MQGVTDPSVTDSQWLQVACGFERDFSASCQEIIRYCSKDTLKHAALRVNGNRTNRCVRKPHESARDYAIDSDGAFLLDVKHEYQRLSVGNLCKS